MTEANENEADPEAGIQDETTANVDPGELKESTEPDLSLLNGDARSVLEASLELLQDFQPQPGTLSDLPQITIESRHILQACQRLKTDSRTSAKMLLCLTCVDYSQYFQLVYILQSLDPERTLVVKTNVPYDQPSLPSVTSVWRAADWHEREAHDLFGVDFEGHPDLAPLLLYEGFEGYPGRKEFPFYEYQEF